MLLFIRMWALAHVIHLVSATGSRLDTPWNILVVGAALALIVRPRSGPLLATMLLAQVADYLWEMPESPDHWALILLVNLALLVTMLVRRSWTLEALEGALPAARVILLIVYSSAAISKYNTSFLDPVTSCANAIANAASMGAARPFSDTPILGFVALAIETSVPILLAIPATRRHGVRVALMFHFALSASPAFAVVDFTATLFALFLLFLSQEDLARMFGAITRLTSKSAVVRDASRRPPITALIAFVAFGLSGYFSARLAAALTYIGSEIYLLVLVIAALATWRHTQRARRRIGRVAWIHVPVLALALLWALNPYLGLRTTGVFTMFSSIRTEGSEPNHLFIPSFRLTDWQDQMVSIDSSSDNVLDGAAENHLAVPLMTLRKLATDDPTLTVSGLLAGQPVTFGPDAGQTELAPLNWWEYHALAFRPVAPDGIEFCSNS